MPRLLSCIIEVAISSTHAVFPFFAIPDSHTAAQVLLYHFCSLFSFLGVSVAAVAI